MQFCGLYRIENILPKYCPQENSISQTVSSCGSMYLFLLITTRNVTLAINSCLQDANESLSLCSSWVQLPSSWHISSRRENMDTGFLNYFLLSGVLSFEEPCSVTANVLILFLSCANRCWLRAFSPCSHTSCESLLVALPEACHHQALQKIIRREHWVKNNLSSKYKN